MKRLLLILFALAPTWAIAQNKVLIDEMTADDQIVFADATDYDANVAAANDLGGQDVQLDLTDFASDDWWQSTKADFGTDWSRRYVVIASMEFATAPVAGETIDFFWSASYSSTAANANMAFTSGTDGSYDGYGAASADAEEASKQLIFLGSLVLTADDPADDAHIGFVGVFTPPLRYGSLVVHNNTSDALATDANEMAIAFYPITDEIQ